MYRLCAFEGTSAPLTEGMDLSRICGVHTPTIPVPIDTPPRFYYAPYRVGIVLEKGGCFTQLCTDGLLWPNQNDMGESGPMTVSVHTVLRLRHEDLRQMAKLERGKVAWLDEMGLVIKVEALGQR